MDELNGVFQFSDAVTVILNILNEARVELEGSWYQDEFECMSARIHALEDVLEALSTERGVMHHVKAYQDHEDAS